MRAGGHPMSHFDVFNDPRIPPHACGGARVPFSLTTNRSDEMNANITRSIRYRIESVSGEVMDLTNNLRDAEERAASGCRYYEEAFRVVDKNTGKVERTYYPRSWTLTAAEQPISGQF
jgi:hypothetical protein